MNAVDELLIKWANNDLTPAEQVELGNHYSTADLEHFIIDSRNVELETSNVKTEWEKLEPQLIRNKSNSKSNYVIGIITILFLLAVGYWYISSLGPDKTIENRTYEPLLFAMEDETEILLAPGSSLSFNESRFVDHRKVWLDGRAYFDVRVKGDFTVATDNSIVSVLGTTFDIWELDDDVLVVQCFSGKVNVSTSNGMGAILNAGQKYSLVGESVGIGEIDNSNEPKWLSKSIVFEGIALSTVYKDLEKYYPIKFVGHASKVSFNGELPTDNLQKVTEILNAVTSDTYKIENNQVVVSKSE
ncbi:MAG: transmembrane sensor [Saprospiraceae bacterium]|jgi:transmembrane sensor|tara:strand:- start:291 stop:1193 length:903 start_codon:yes stop_codon:yes gene_type:complete